MVLPSARSQHLRTVEGEPNTLLVEREGYLKDGLDRDPSEHRHLLAEVYILYSRRLCVYRAVVNRATQTHKHQPSLTTCWRFAS